MTKEQAKEFVELWEQLDREGKEIMLSFIPLAVNNDDFLKEASQCTTRKGVLECIKKYA